MRALVTGGAGFIGSHLVDRLLAEGHRVVVYDNPLSGRLAFLGSWLDHPALTFVQGDVLDIGRLEEAVDGCDAVFHLAANPDVRAGLSDTALDLRQEALATYSLLEAMRRRSVGAIVLASSSAVYGAVPDRAVDEEHGPLLPVSLYGAGKLAAEGLVSAFCHLFGLRGWIFRLANVVGPHKTHGVILELASKLEQNPRELEVLGDGRQEKPYLHVSDCVDGMLFGFHHGKDAVNIFNLSSDDAVDVATIARTVVAALALDPHAVALRFTGGAAGWPGDVPRIRLSTARLRSLGWRAHLTSQEAVERAARELAAERRSGS